MLWCIHLELCEIIEWYVFQENYTESKHYLSFVSKKQKQKKGDLPCAEKVQNISNDKQELLMCLVFPDSCYHGYHWNPAECLLCK